MTVHESPLRHRLTGLRKRHPIEGCPTLEDWLLEVANARGADIVSRHPGEPMLAPVPGPDELSNEELVGGLCQIQGADRPHLLRPAAQLISRGAVDCRNLARLAQRERLAPILGPMARAALRIDPGHRIWKFLSRCFPQSPPRKNEPVIHWTRLAEPTPVGPPGGPVVWKLVT